MLITLDTTRADRLGCYGYGPGVTPNLDRLAAEGVRFRRAYAHVPLTAPSHASILTGLLPPRHGVHDNGAFALPEGPTTLAEVFLDAGYRTGGFVSAFVLDRRFGLARGFATYDDDVLGGGADNVEASVRAEVTVGRALEWIRTEDSRPFFCWVHLYDPHAPYDPPEPFAKQLSGRPYDGEIAYMDSEVGRLLAALRTLGTPTLVAVMGDHGESLGEHQESTHMYYVYGATQRVPFILHLPGHLPEGVVVDPVVRSVDLMPTVLEIAGLPCPAGLDGASLVPLITGRARQEPGPAYLESYTPRIWWGARELLGLRTGRWLYIRSPRPELYDVEQDPGELRNVIDQHPTERAALDARLQELQPAKDPLAGRSPVDPEAAARLRALGYLATGSAPEATDAGSLPDAKDNGALLIGFTRGNDLLREGRPEEALAVLQDTLQQNPRSLALRGLIAQTLLRVGRNEEALARFRELHFESPDTEEYALGMARALSQQARHDDALRLLQGLEESFPHSALLAERAGTTLLALGRTADAEREYRKAIARAPRYLLPYLRLGVVLEKEGHVAEARAVFQTAVETSPRSREAREAARGLMSTGGRLLEEKRYADAREAYYGALEAGVASEEAYSNLGLACYRLGRHREALEVLLKGVRRLPDSPSLHYRAGRLLQEAGRAREAETELRRSLELEPDRRDARQALDRLLTGAATRGGESTR